MEKSRAAINSGDRLGPYRIDRLLGKGGMGEVYLAFEQPLDRPVALKIIKANETQEKELVTRFLNEGRTLSLINHQNVVTVFSVSQIEPYYYIAMEFIDGISIDDICRDFALPAREAVVLFLQMVEGLSALHAKNIVHRDLKPQNIIYQKNNIIKILDLGIAKIYGDEAMNATSTGMIIGTVRYIAPEVAHGMSATSASDIWSLGAIFYELLTGTRLIPANNQMEALTSLINLKVEFPPECSNWCEPEMQQIVKRMCAVNPENRYKDTVQLHADLQRFTQKFPSRGLWHYQNLGSHVKNSLLVKQRLKELGYSSSAAKRIMVDALYLSKVLRTAKTNPDTTTKIEMGMDETITGAALTRAIEGYETGVSRAIVKRGHKSLIYGSAFVLAAILGAGVWFFNPPKNVVETTIPTPPAAQLPAPAPTSVLPVTQQASVPEDTRVPHDFEVKKSEVPAEIQKPPVPQAPAVTESKPPARANVEPDGFHLKVPELTTPKEKLVLNFSAGSRGPATDVPQNPPRLTWNSIPGAKSYSLEISQSPDFRNLLLNQQTENNFVVWKQVRPGDFHWRVRGKNARSKFSNFSESGLLSVYVPAPKIPHTLEQKVMASAADSNPKAHVQLKWPPVPFAKKYRLNVNDNGTGTSVFKDIIDGSETSLSLPAGAYTAQVMPLDGTGEAIAEGPATSKIQIQLQVLTPAPKLVSPPDSSSFTISGETEMPIVFFWSKTEGALNYTIEIAADPAFKKSLASESVSDNRFIFKRKVNPGTFYWRVRTKTATATSDWSAPRRFIASEQK